MSGQHLFGVHAALALLRRMPREVTELLLARRDEDAPVRELLELARAAGVAVRRCERRTLDELTGAQAHQGVVVICRRLPHWDEAALFDHLDELRSPALLLVLDTVQDPHNLGACLRTANAAGAHAVIAPKDRACGMTPAVVKVASGAAGLVPFVRVTNLARFLGAIQARNIWTVGTAGEAPDSLFATRFAGDTAIVMGAEGAGLRRLTRERCDQLVHIPLHGDVASLNVSVAAGIALYEVVRQRLVH